MDFSQHHFLRIIGIVYHYLDKLFMALFLLGDRALLESNPSTR
jgi:hypothetical protein